MAPRPIPGGCGNRRAKAGSTPATERAGGGEDQDGDRVVALEAKALQQPIRHRDHRDVRHRICLETHAIWSSGVPKFARMSLSATFTMEMSRNAIRPASMAPVVISGLLREGRSLGAHHSLIRTVTSRAHSRAADPPREDIQADEHRDALHDLHEIPVALSGWQQSEARAGFRRDALDVAAKFAPAVGIRGAPSPSGPRASQRAVLLEVGHDPDVVERNDGEGEDVGADGLAILDAGAARRCPCGPPARSYRRDSAPRA